MGRRLSLVACFLALAIAVFGSDARMLRERIVGGEVVGSAETYPWFVSLRKNGLPWCGGSLIGEKWVLTAAHCFEGESNLAVWSAVLKQVDVNANAGITRSIRRAILHPQYNTNTISNDFCLLELRERVTGIAPVRLNTVAGTYVAPTVAKVIGFGAVGENAEGSDKLLQVELPIRTDSECSGAYGNSFTSSVMLCAGFHAGGKDSCQGDSGGPFFVGGVQIGVVSWGIGCARAGYFGIYAKVSTAIAWIESTTGLSLSEHTNNTEQETPPTPSLSIPSVVQTACKNIASVQVITSENPTHINDGFDNYPNNLDGHCIVVTGASEFELKLSAIDFEANYDYLSVSQFVNGGALESKGRFTGILTDKGPWVVPGGGYVILKMDSDLSVTRTGFQGEARLLPRQDEEPNFPADYNGRLLCPVLKKDCQSTFGSAALLELACHRKDSPCTEFECFMHCDTNAACASFEWSGNQCVLYGSKSKVDSTTCYDLVPCENRSKKEKKRTRSFEQLKTRLVN